MNAIKKLGLAIGISVGLAVSAFADGSPTITHVTQSFINGCNLILSNNVTIKYGYTNLLFVNKKGGGDNSLSNTAVFYTNAVGVTSNIITSPPAIVDVNAYPDLNGNPGTNTSIIIVMNSTNLFLGELGAIPNPNNTNSVNSWAPSIVAPGVTIGASSTNTITLTFARTTDGYGNKYIGQQGGVVPDSFGTTAPDQFVWSFAAPGASVLVMSTNLPVAFLTATKSIRLVSAVSSTASGSSGVIINVLKMGGWSP